MKLKDPHSLKFLLEIGGHALNERKTTMDFVKEKDTSYRLHCQSLLVVCWEEPLYSHRGRTEHMDDISHNGGTLL